MRLWMSLTACVMSAWGLFYSSLGLQSLQKNFCWCLMFTLIFGYRHHLCTVLFHWVNIEILSNTNLRYLKSENYII